ncbi:ABC transporter substrate-binding protein [Propionimicrobium sp. PCR01-08-3]|uniref:ABC transporter substrate-binding protein n=1 Tax=Propionimicrobium sp. PCR01-08-3 TaxID=3052086 RepID=UPI00255C745D|nr:ABC transporter substrate-binding protein [Propionimicrobium sp. PCR01-08-3]WIY84132.1 ABC transporter substrate-binding protein [Propionimicrobium sp. PCR01-08-3]
MKRSLAAVAAATLSLSLLAGCGGSDGADSDVVKVGVNYELSGNVATYGDASVKGVEMAFEEINAAGGINGKQVEMVKYDTKSEPAEATTLATKLMTQDKVVTVIGPATSGSFKATIPVANQNEIPVVSGSATAEDTTVSNGQVQEYAFRTCFSDNFQGTAMANFASNELDVTNAVVIKDTSSDYAKGLAENFTNQLQENGGSVVGEEGYVAGDTDFQAILTRIKGQSFDAIYLPGYYNEVGLIIKQARELGITAPILGGDGYESPTLLQLAGADALNDVYYTNHYSSLDEGNTKVADFTQNFQEKYNAEPDAFAALGYDTAYFVADAIGRAGDLSGEAVKDAMASTTDFEGVTGTFSINENHDPDKAALVIGLTDGVPSSAVEAA